MDKNAKIFVTGHRGMVGSAIVRRLEQQGYTNIIGRTHAELDLMNQQAVFDFFAAEKPEYVYLAAAKVGGIMANNTYRGEFLYNNMVIEMNVIHAAHMNGVKKLLFLGSSCIYPRFAEQPLKEEYLLTGELEPTNEPYAIAKIAGIKICDAYRAQYGDNYISAMPTNLYGPNDHYDLQNSHVLPALIRRFHEAKLRGDADLTLWGDGTPLREFLHVDDMAEAAVFLMETYNEPGHVNVGVGEDLTIKALAEMIKDIVGFEGTLSWDTSKPNGMYRKLMDVSKINALGWKAKIGLRDGITAVYEQYAKDHPTLPEA